jgi:NarL family two-component system response regulator LiaR
MGDTMKALASAAEGGCAGRADDTGGALTRRESQVLRLLASGFSTLAMAESLGVSSYTVRNHLRNIFAKIEVHSRVQATVYAWRHGLL